MELVSILAGVDGPAREGANWRRAGTLAGCGVQSDAIINEKMGSVSLQTSRAEVRG